MNLDKADIQATKNKLHKKFEMIDLSSYIYYLDITIAKNRVNRILRLEQTTYIKKFFIDHDIIESIVISILIIDDKFHTVENDFVIIKKSHYIY